MKLNFLVAPDFPPERFAGWHLLNTVLQSRSGLHLHLQTPATPQEQADLVRAGGVDLVYANPFDASELIRGLGYKAIAKPLAKPDEMVIATSARSGLQQLEGLRPGARIAVTDNRDVKLIGLRLLEAADLTETDIQWVLTETFQGCARMALKGEVEAAFFMADTYHALSRITRSQLTVLIESALDDIHHVLLAHPDAASSMPVFTAALCSMGQQAQDHEVLQALGLPDGFSPMTTEEAEFMMDLMETLLD
jgi:phosphonate transport system substrate-binding protein